MAPCTISGKAAPSTGAALDDDLDSYFAVKPKKGAAAAPADDAAVAME